MPAKKGKPPGGSDPPSSSSSDSSDSERPSKVKRMREDVVEFLEDFDSATSAVVQQEMIRGQSGRMVKVDSLAGRTAQVELLRNEVAQLKDEMYSKNESLTLALGERDALQREVELLRIAVKEADKQDNHIHILEETIAEKDKKIAELLNAQVAIADASLSADNGEDNSAGVDPITPSSSGLSNKFDSLSFREPEDSDSD